MAELTIELYQFLGTVVTAAVGVALYVARLHWKINMIEDRIKNNPLLSAFQDYEKKDGVVGFLDSTLRRGRVESRK